MLYAVSSKIAQLQFCWQIYSNVSVREAFSFILGLHVLPVYALAQ